ETLTSYDSLAAICAAVGGERVAFSLDLRGGEPMIGRSAVPHEPPETVAQRARDAGAATLIVIDVARVGVGAGVDLRLVARVRRAAPGLALLAGGGIRDRDDLASLAEAGCDGALVATALHDGRISAGDVSAADRYSVSR